LIWRISFSALVLAALSGCGPSYSPDTYATNAAQQANKVEQGIVVGVRTVGISAAGTVGTVTGAAAGGIAGSQAVAGPISAFTALGGSLVGGIAGSTVEHATADTMAFEYIVRKGNGDLVSVTQKDKTPLALGQKVLVIAGNQARVVPDYTVPPSKLASKDDAAKSADSAKPDGSKPDADKSADASKATAAPADGSKPGSSQAATDPLTDVPAAAKAAEASSDGKTAQTPAASVTPVNPWAASGATPATTPTATPTAIPGVTPASVAAATAAPAAAATTPVGQSKP
jgi:outer membrane lipoprotein SlyB